MKLEERTEVNLVEHNRMSRDSGGKNSRERKSRDSHDSGRSEGHSRSRSSSHDDKSGGRGQEMVNEVYCIYNGEVKGLRADEVMMHYQCSQLTERECITGGPLGQCEWVGSIHKLESLLVAEEEVKDDANVNVLDVHITTMDMVLAIAFLVTAAFAVEQLYRWWLRDEDEKLQGSTSDAQPLLV